MPGKWCRAVRRGHKCGHKWGGIACPLQMHPLRVLPRKTALGGPRPTCSGSTMTGRREHPGVTPMTQVR